MTALPTTPLPTTPPERPPLGLVPPLDDAMPVPIVCLPTVSVVIPTLNEAENLPHVLERLPSWVYQVVIADGSSTDDTVAVALEHC